jgi:hypothetical protein
MVVTFWRLFYFMPVSSVVQFYRSLMGRGVSCWLGGEALTLCINIYTYQVLNVVNMPLSLASQNVWHLYIILRFWVK